MIGDELNQFSVSVLANISKFCDTGKPVALLLKEYRLVMNGVVLVKDEVRL